MRKRLTWWMAGGLAAFIGVAIGLVMTSSLTGLPLIFATGFLVGAYTLIVRQ